MTTRRYPPIHLRGCRALFSRWLLGALAVLVGGVLAVLGASPAHADDPYYDNDLFGKTINTPYGPLGPADRDLLIRVKQAGLWEGPVGHLAQERAASPRVKEVGATLESDHAALDDQTDAVAVQLGVTLPSVPSTEQQGWIDELSTKRGADFDRTFADRLRAAHGKVFGIVAEVRAGTRNDVVRAFATTGVNIVMKHMTLLESTGFVPYDVLPEPAVPMAAPVDRIANTFGNGPGAPLVWLVLIAAIIAGASAVTRIVRPR